MHTMLIASSFDVGKDLVVLVYDSSIHLLSVAGKADVVVSNYCVEAPRSQDWAAVMSDVSLENVSGRMTLRARRTSPTN